MEKSFAMISLGCAKNLVNSEQMLYLMSEAGFTLLPDPDGADLVIVNTWTPPNPRPSTTSSKWRSSRRRAGSAG